MWVFQNGAFQVETGPYVHRASSTFDQMRDKRNDISKRKQWILSNENEKHTIIVPNTDNI